MELLFHLGFEDLVADADTAHLEIHVGMGLTGGQGRDVVVEVDPLGERGVDGAFELLFELRVTDQDEFEPVVVIEGGADQQAKIDQGLGVEQLGFIDEQQRGGVEGINFVDDLQQDLVLVLAWRLAQRTGEQAQEGDIGEA